MKLSTLKPIASLIAARQYKRAAEAIDTALESESGPSWQRSLGALSAFLRDPEHAPFASVLAQGNAKLPFLAFGTLPGDSCPGAGECIDWCYSFKAWRYPAAFARQAQNLVLIRENPAAVFAAFDKYRDRGEITFRLYTDGDFDSVETVNKWWDFLSQNPWVIAYGYSKSFQQLLNAKPAPANYRLNLSSGHNHTPATVRKISKLAMVRGHFIAVDMGRRVAHAEHNDRTHQAALRKAYGKPAFTCPGECGSCTPTGHACGSDRFAGVDIIIAAH
jgi:hypothetical protein